MSASETHNRKNINKGIDETFPVLEEAVRLARSRGKRVRGYVSTVFGCPYEGEVSVAQVAKVCERLFEMGVYEISLGDTIGVAHPRQVKEVLQQLLRQFPADRLAGHFHDTRGTALVNAYVALELGITTLDSSFGGSGGLSLRPRRRRECGHGGPGLHVGGHGRVDGDPFGRPVPGKRPGSAADRPQASVQGVAEHPIKPAGKGRRRMNEVEWERMEGISVITLNRPEVYNALNFATLKELMKIVEELTHSKATRAVIITGAGEKAFCSGADLKERRTFTEDQVRRYIHLIRETFTAIERLPRPVIAAVNGVALGGGMELALACDLRLADERAVFGLTETSLGIIPGAGGTQRLPRIVGKSMAKELIFTARRIDAAEAERIGLVNHVVSKGEVLDAALEMAEMINENAPLALAQAKFAIDYGMETDLATGLMIETKAYEALIPTKDRLEGLEAFKEKRKPIYRGE